MISRRHRNGSSICRKSSVRFNSGGSGSFISADGLVITNHHVGADTLQKLSSAEHNYLRNGFYAKTQAEEQRALDLELNVLDSIEDVTARVNAAVKPGMNSDAALAARRAIIAQIEKESQDKTGLRSDVVTLYQGGSYQLYRYKVYTDVRLVFAPEQQAAFYGGDPDNFEYPRYDLDICIFRVYENGKPAKIENFLEVQPGRREERRPRLRQRQPRPDRPRIDCLRSGGSARPFVSGMARDVLSAGSCSFEFQRTLDRECAARPGRTLRRAEQPQGF